MIKVWLDQRYKKIVDKSGIGKAIEHQLNALSQHSNIKLTDYKESQIVHFNTIFPTTIISSKLAKKRGKKIVIHAHSTMEDFKNSFKFSNQLAPLFKKWLCYCYKQADIIITPTRYSQYLLSNYNLNTPIYAISNGIDLSYFHEDRTQSRDKKMIISVGHYIERKGLIDFVTMAKRCPQYQFYWYGYTEPSLQTKSIKEALAIQLPNLHFPGYVTKNELKNIYNKASLFLFMTYEETEGIVLLEAFAMKVPVLIRDITIYQDMFQANQDVYKFHDLDDCQQKIEDILQQRLPSLVETAYQQAEERDICKIGKQLFERYQQLLHE